VIARIWTGAVRKDDGDAYAEYMRETGVAGYARTPGNNGIWMLHRDVDDRTEFVMFTLWDSVDSVEAFAGRNLARRPAHGSARTRARRAVTTLHRASARGGRVPGGVAITDDRTRDTAEIGRRAR
jgi:heme-degrading monooxygenase HmoA